MIYKDLVVGAVSLDIALGDRKLNISRVKHVLDCWGDKLNVMVLPEMFSTGFLSDENQLNDVAEDDGGQLLENCNDCQKSMIYCSQAAIYQKRAALIIIVDFCWRQMADRCFITNGIFLD